MAKLNFKKDKKNGKRTWGLLGLIGLIIFVLLLVVLFAFLRIAFWIALIVGILLAGFWVYKFITDYKETTQETQMEKK